MRRRAILAALGSAAVAGCRSSPSTGGSANGVELVAPERALVDERLAVEARGLPSGERVTFTASTITENRGTQRWSASATYTVPDDGRVALAEHAPTGGSYEGIDPMGLVWSMTASEPPKEVFFPLQRHELRLRATVDGSRVAETTVERGITVEGTTTVAPGSDVVGTVHLPPGTAAAPGVVLLHGSHPRERTAAAKMLAAHGFAALTLKYFGSERRLPSHLSEVPVESVQRALGAFLSHERVAGPQVGVWGISKGAELALLLASLDDRVGTVVGTAPSSVVWEGFERDGTPTGTSSWTVGGEPVPYVDMADYDAVGETADPYERPRAFYEYSHLQASATTIEAASIPVERIAGPVLLVSGRADRLWHSTPMGERVLRRLEARGHAHAHDHLAYEGAGHVIPIPYVPTYGTSESVAYPLGGSPAATAAASRNHWPALLDHLAALDGDGGVDSGPVEEPVATDGGRSVNPNSPAVPVALAALVGLGLAARRAGPPSNTGVLNRETYDAISTFLDSPTPHLALTAVAAALGAGADLLGTVGDGLLYWLFAFVVASNYAGEVLWVRCTEYFERTRDQHEAVGRTLAPPRLSVTTKVTLVAGTVLFASYVLFALLLVRLYG